MRIFLCCISIPLFFVLTGCDNNVPKDLPKLYPITLTIIQENKPLEGAVVTLVPESGTETKWSQSGLTDAQGVVFVATNGRFPGAPQGRYKVLVQKNVREAHPFPKLANSPPGTPEDAKYVMAERARKEFSHVDSSYAKADTTPLMVEVLPKKRNEKTLNVGQEVKKPL